MITPDVLARRLRRRGYFLGALEDCTDERGAAAALNVSRRTLISWRAQGIGPPCYQTSRWLYPLDGLVAFVRKNSICGNMQIEANPADQALRTDDRSRETAATQGKE